MINSIGIRAFMIIMVEYEFSSIIVNFKIKETM